MINAPRTATQKPETLKPWIKVAMNQKRKPLIMKVERPSVKSVIGKVRSNRIGLMVMLIIPQMIETMRAV